MTDERETSGDWLAVAVVALAVFSVTTTEMMPVGVLPGIASSFDVSEGQAGLSVSLYGLLSGLSAPPLALVTRRVARRNVLLAILAVFTLGNAACALAPGFVTFMVARLAVGLAHGLLWALVATIAVRLVLARDAVRATTWVFSGISLALVLGVPIGAAIDAAVSWRAAFWLLSALGALSFVLIAVRVPSLAARPSSEQPTVRALLRSPSLRSAAPITAIVVVGNYAAYTYVAPFLSQERGIDLAYVAPLLLAYGIAGVAGNALAGTALTCSGSPLAVLRALSLTATAALVLLLTTSSIAALVLLLVVWGAAYSGMPVALQTLVLAGSRTGELASALYVMVFNVSIAVGALLGGLAIDAHGPTAPLVVGAVVGAGSGAVTALAHRRAALPA